jgi:hypothetical protein
LNTEEPAALFSSSFSIATCGMNFLFPIRVGRRPATDLSVSQYETRGVKEMCTSKWGVHKINWHMHE